MNLMFALWRLANRLGRTERAREAAVRWVCQFAYLTRQTPWDSGIAPPELVDLVEGEHAVPAGRALDLGCGTGTNSVYLARHGWDVVGVDLVDRAVRRARARARAAGVAPRLLRGDVTRLDALPTGDGFSLFFDLGCFSGIPRHRRDAYAAGITRRAAPDARLLLFGFGPDGPPGPGTAVTADELRARFPGWRLASAVRGTGPMDVWWFRLHRAGAT